MSGLFESARLVYESVGNTEADRDFVWRAVSDPSSISPGSVGLPKPPRRSESDDFVERKIKSSLVFVKICLPPAKAAGVEPSTSKPKPIGILALKKFGEDLEPTLQTSFGPLYILPEHRRKGYAFEAMNWILDWGFRHGRMHRISLQVNGANEGAIQLYRTLGFVEEGRLRDAHYFGGEWFDVLQFAILEDEWRALRARTQSSSPYSLIAIN